MLGWLEGWQVRGLSGEHRNAMLAPTELQLTECAILAQQTPAVSDTCVR